MDKELQSHKNKSQELHAPQKKAVFVECGGRSRFAYLDQQGTWRDYYTDELLENAIHPKSEREDNFRPQF